jgi:subfamily B ATP-binding cassette protein MsbA
MNTYLRLLSFARPLGARIPKYIIFTLLSIVFSLATLTLVVPVLEVLFDQISAADMARYSQKPEFEPSIDFLKQWFYYHLISWKAELGSFTALIYVAIILCMASLLSNLFKYLSNIELAHVRINSVSNLRKTIFDQVSHLHIGYFTNERKGDIMSRITNDVQEVERSIVSSLTVVFRDPATIIIYFILLFIMSPQLTFFTIIILPISGWLISGIAKRLKKAAKESQESLGRIVNILDESLGGMRVIKAFNARSFISGRFSKEIDFYADVNINMARRNELASPISEFLGVFFVSGILIFGGYLVLNDESNLDAPAFIAYIAIFAQVLQPGKNISKSLTSIQRGLASGERIFAVLDARPAIQDSPDARPVQEFKQAITFKNVSFAYGEEKVLHHINLTVQKGTTVALVGPSGGGKSTLADLVPRFYDPTEGELLLDGQPLQAYEVESLRRLMGIVTQESILFNDTIFNNIAFGIPEASEEAVIRAAKIANAHDFIMQTEGGYQTRIGERGSRLSGGQRQRLSIARAVLKNPPILILDEATSALDSESEMLVQEALTNLMRNRTSIVIAHRLSTIQHADEIVVIENGEIVERGNHQELLEQEGLYKKLSLMQSV